MTTGHLRPLQPGDRIYAIGDIHGRSDLLDDLHRLIRDDLRRPFASAEIIYLGDYVDRGPDSAGVLERLARPAPDLPPATALVGNHDVILRDYINGAAHLARAWRDFGGGQTLVSYGGDPAIMNRADWAQAAMDAFARLMPASHRALLDRLAFSYDRPPYFFCHAGVRPGVALDRQTSDDLLWIREEFLDSNADFGRVVVHGHTPVREPDIRRNQINVDTGAVTTGVLTCAVLEADTVRMLQTRP